MSIPQVILRCGQKPVNAGAAGLPYGSLRHSMETHSVGHGFTVETMVCDGSEQLWLRSLTQHTDCGSQCTEMGSVHGKSESLK